MISSFLILVAIPHFTKIMYIRKDSEITVHILFAKVSTET